MPLRGYLEHGEFALDFEAFVVADGDKAIGQFFDGVGGEPAHLFHEMDGGGIFGALSTVYDFDGESHAFTHSAQTLDTFGSGFADNFALGQPHDFGVELSVTCHEIRVQGHGTDDAFEV